VFLAVDFWLGFSFWFSSLNRGGLFNIRLVLAFATCFQTFYIIVLFLLPHRWLCLKMSKISLFVRTRRGGQGRYIASVPLKKLEKLSKFRKKRWTFKDGWLILEAY